MPLATPGDPNNARAYDLVTMFSAPVGTTAPTDTTTALNAAFINLGLISEDELTIAVNVDRNELRSMGGALVRVKRTAQTRSFALSLLENSHKVWEAGNPGSTATTTTGITTRVTKAHTTVQWAIVFEAIEGSIKTRFWIPKAELFSDGDKKLGPSQIAMTPITVMVYPDSTTTFYNEISNDAAAAAS